MDSLQATENSKIGVRGGIIGWFIWYATPKAGFLFTVLESDITQTLSRDHIEAFIYGTVASLGGVGGISAWMRNKLSPQQNAVVTSNPEITHRVSASQTTPLTTTAVSTGLSAPTQVLQDFTEWKFSTRSLNNLSTCHPDLVKVAYRALEISKYDFTVICGLRTVDEQRVLFKAGKSKTMNSRHIGLNGKSFALDFMVIGENGGTWDIEPYYHEVSAAFKAAAKELGVAVVSGYDWKNHWDSGHLELDSAVYPDEPDYALT